MCRSAAEGGRRCNGRSCGAASARIRQARSRARRGLEAAHAAGDPDAIAAAEAKYTAVTGAPPPALPTTQEQPMPKPEKPTPATTEDRIRAVFRELATEPGDWIRLSRLREKLGDLDQAEVTRALTELNRTDPDFVLAPQANRKALTDDDHAATVPLGMGEQAHVLSIQPPSIDGAADHVQQIGVANATDEELENGLYAPEVRSALYDEIRAEQKRRKEQATPSTPEPPANTTASVATGTPEERIRAAFQSLATRPRQFVKLADVRNLIGDDITHDQLQETLLSMARTGTVHLSPDSNRRGLTQADHDTAVTIGREAKHLLSIEPDDE